LRTALRLERQNIVQAIAADVEVPLEISTLDSVPDSEKFELALRSAAKQATLPFDLGTAPLMRAALYRVGEDDHVLALCFHQAIFDGWSEFKFIQQLGTIYAAGDGELVELPDPVRQYAEFAVAQEQQAATQSAEDARRLVVGTAAPLNLPFDRVRPAKRSNRGGLESIRLSRELTASIERFSTTQGLTMFTTLLTAYAVLLHRYSGDEEMMIGVIRNGRPSRDFENTIGCFTSSRGVRVDMRGNPSLLTVLKRIREALSSDEPNEARLFQVMFALQHPQPSALSFGSLRVTPLVVHSGTSKCDLLLNVVPSDPAGDLSCRLEFDSDQFEASTAVRLLESYRLLLENAVAEAERPIGILPVVSDEQRRALAQWSKRPVEYPKTSSLHRQFEAVARARPDAVALSEGSEHVSYAELDVRANRLAGRLRREGAQRGELIGLCLERSIAAVVAQLAILKAGCAYLPLDPSYPTSRLELMLDDAGVRFVFATESTAGSLSRSVAKTLRLDTDLTGDGEATIPIDDGVGADDLAYVMYTSGSTGQPNGVRIPHRGVLRLVLGTDYIEWDSATTFLQMASLSFDASTFEVWGALLHGKRLVVFPDRVPTVRRLAEVLSAERVDCLWLTAALFNVVIDEQPGCLAGVSQLIIGGEALSVRHVHRAQQLLPHTQIVNGYGPTECTTFACCYRVPRLAADDRRSIPIGRPISNTSLYVWDRRKRPVPIGVRGELYIGGDGVALGYHARAELTAERFVPDPESSLHRLYRTGDFVRWRTDGVLEFLGRSDSQVKIRGFRIEPGEIEAACRRHPAVRDAVVLVVRGSSGEDALVAFLTKDDSTPSSADILDFLRQILPTHLVPAAVMFCDAIPLTINGKVDRDALLNLHHPLAGGRELLDRHATATEEALRQIWRDVLNTEDIGVNDDFFALGGHSLLAVRMFSRIHEVLGHNIPFATLLQYPTIAQLAAALDVRREAPSRGASIVALKEGGHRPPIFLVHGIGNEIFTFVELAKQLRDDQPVFGVIPPDEATSGVQSIEDMATAYLTEVEKRVQNQPFILGGHCSGALTALEMARQRQLRGLPVPQLLVFDFWLREEPAGVMSSVVNVINWLRDDFAHAGMKNNVGRIRSKLRLLRGRAERLVLRRQTADDVRDLLGMWRYPEHEVERLRRFTEATEAYRVSPHDSPIHVFRARTGRLRRLQPPADMGWLAIARGPLRIETVPGSHDTMFRRPFVETLARRIEAAVDDERGGAMAGSQVVRSSDGLVI
jgi:amino acid adenylation domain-containing protein